ncbi:MAG: regulator [Rhodobacteraceae bacterium]|nr:regulator [Paracoccaceae bacterium]
MKQIDANLRKVYQETLEQEIPERFQQLLERLKERDSGDDRG